MSVVCNTAMIKCNTQLFKPFSKCDWLLCVMFNDVNIVIHGSQAVLKGNCIYAEYIKLYPHIPFVLVMFAVLTQVS